MGLPIATILFSLSRRNVRNALLSANLFSRLNSSFSSRQTLATELYQQVFRILGIEIEDERSMGGRSAIHLIHKALPLRQFQLTSHASCRINIGHDFIVGSIQGKVDGICTSDGEDAVLRKKNLLPHPLLDSTDGFFLLLVLASGDNHKACQERYDMFGFHWFTF